MTLVGDHVRSIVRQDKGKRGQVVLVSRYCTDEALTVYWVRFGKRTWAMFEHEFEKEEATDETNHG